MSLYIGVEGVSVSQTEPLWS